MKHLALSIALFLREQYSQSSCQDTRHNFYFVANNVKVAFMLPLLDSFFHFQNYWHGMECKLTSEILFKNR